MCKAGYAVQDFPYNRLTGQEDAFLLACREEVERNGPLVGNTGEWRSRVKARPDFRNSPKKKLLLRLFGEYAWLYGLAFIPAPPNKSWVYWKVVLGNPLEPPTTTVYTGVVARFETPRRRDDKRSSLLTFIKLDGTENEVLVDRRWSCSVGLGDCVEFRVVPDANATCRRCEKSYKAVDVRILEDDDTTAALEAPVAPPADASARPAREAPVEEAPLPTLLRLDADFCLELARELLRSEL